MSRIDAIFEKPGRKALIAYTTVGYPDIKTTLRGVSLLAGCGCDIIELGIPFSDPLADGTTIQKASHQALQNGVTPKLCLELAQELSQRVSIPLVFMTYLNPVLSYGFEAFCTACEESGISGMIIPDLPPEEGLALDSYARKHGLGCIYLLVPNSSQERIKLVAQQSRGFIYLVSLAGVTGARELLPQNLGGFISKVRAATPKPLCVGFGISSPEQAGKVARMADGVIIGSHIIQLMEADASLGTLNKFVKEVREALDEPM